MHSPSPSRDPEKIKSMFAKVANRYDLANNVLSVGIHHLWRKQLVQLSGAQPGDSVLDCATGTGDLALEFARRVGPQKVIGTDFCAEMLLSAPKKAQAENLEVLFETADVMKLSYSDDRFDVASISFGIRNVADPLLALKEMGRVVKPGGRVMVLEFGQATVPGFAQLYQIYSEKILPFIGGLVTGQKAAYEYLQNTSAQFPCRENFLKLMQETNLFSSVEHRSLTGGIAYIYKGVKK